VRSRAILAASRAFRDAALLCGCALLLLGLCAGTACVESVMVKPEATVPLVCEPGPGEPGRVTGHVFDSKSGEPIAGGAVEVWNTEFGSNTDEHGQYMITGVLHPGRYTLIASALGFETERSLVTVRSDSTGVVDFRLRPIHIDIRGSE